MAFESWTSHWFVWAEIQIILNIISDFSFLLRAVIISPESSPSIIGYMVRAYKPELWEESSIGMETSGLSMLLLSLSQMSRRVTHLWLQLFKMSPTQGLCVQISPENKSFFFSAELKEGQLSIVLDCRRISGYLPSTKNKLSTNILLLASLHIKNYLIIRVLTPPILETFYGSAAQMVMLFIAI